MAERTGFLFAAEMLDLGGGSVDALYPPDVYALGQFGYDPVGDVVYQRWSDPAEVPFWRPLTGGGGGGSVTIATPAPLTGGGTGTNFTLGLAYGAGLELLADALVVDTDVIATRAYVDAQDTATLAAAQAFATAAAAAALAAAQAYADGAAAAALVAANAYTDSQVAGFVVATAAPVSGDGTGGNPVTIAAGAIPDASLASTFVHLGGALAEAVTGTKTFVDGLVVATGQALVAGTLGPTTGQQHVVPAVASDVVVLAAAAQTLALKVLTNPTVNAATLTGTLAGTPTFGGVVTFTAAPVVGVNDGTTNAPSVVLTLTHTTTGTAAAGLAARVAATAEDAAGNLETLGFLDATLTNAGNGTEASAWSLYTRTGGAAPAATWTAWGSGGMSLGTTAGNEPAAGSILMPRVGGLYGRNTINTGNVFVCGVGGSNEALLGNGTGPVTVNATTLSLVAATLLALTGPVRIQTAFQAAWTDASATPGPATINKPSGRVAVPAGAQSVTVTNSLSAAASRVFAVINQATDDATATVVRRVDTSTPGSFVIQLNAVATAAVKVDWFVMLGT